MSNNNEQIDNNNNLNDSIQNFLTKITTNLPSYMSKIPNFISSIKETLKDPSSKNIISVIKKMLIDNNINITKFFPESVKQKSVIGIVHKSILSSVDYMYEVKDCVVFIDEKGKNRDDLFREVFFKLINYLNKLSLDENTEEREEFINIFRQDVNYIINKNIEICNINLSESIKKCKEKEGFKEEKIKSYFESIYILLNNFILPKIENIDIDTILSYYEI